MVLRLKKWKVDGTHGIPLLLLFLSPFSQYTTVHYSIKSALLSAKSPPSLLRRSITQLPSLSFLKLFFSPSTVAVKADRGANLECDGESGILIRNTYLCLCVDILYILICETYSFNNILVCSTIPDFYCNDATLHFALFLSYELFFFPSLFWMGWKIARNFRNSTFWAIKRCLPRLAVFVQ